MPTESDFIEAINANPDDRLPQFVYADWLDEQGDPRGEAWRVLIEAGKRPTQWFQPPAYDWHADTFGDSGEIEDELTEAYSPSFWRDSRSFFEAMNDYAIAWVRCHRDAEFEPDLLHRS